MVGRSVTIMSPAKTAEPIEMPFGLWTRVGPRNHVLDGVQISPWKGAILSGKGWPIVKYSDHRPRAAAMRPSLSNYFDHALDIYT